MDANMIDEPSSRRDISASCDADITRYSRKRDKDMMVDDRYSGRAGIFESLDDEESSAADKDPDKPLKCKYNLYVNIQFF